MQIGMLGVVGVAQDDFLSESFFYESTMVEYSNYDKGYSVETYTVNVP
jgi:hypothetical protein